MSDATEIAAPSRIAPLIRCVREQRVILDSDIAGLYGVQTRALVQAVKRNAERFPGDFLFQLILEETAALRSQTVISKPGRGGRRYPPYALTEHGALMAATVLNSSRAVAMSLYITPNRFPREGRRRPIPYRSPLAQTQNRKPQMINRRTPTG